MKLRYFKEDDFKCKCGCKADVVDYLKYKIDDLRHRLKIPLVINSGARCVAHNKANNYSDTSSHIKGLAVDIRVTTNKQKAMIIHEATKMGFTRIGLANSFVHLDIDDNKVNAIWDYK